MLFSFLKALLLHHTCTLYSLQPLAKENTDKSVLLKHISVLTADFSVSSERIIKICQQKRELISTFNAFMVQETCYRSCHCCRCWAVSISTGSCSLAVQDVSTHTSCWSSAICLYQTTLHFLTNVSTHEFHGTEAAAWRDPSLLWQEMTGFIADLQDHLFKNHTCFPANPTCSFCWAWSKAADDYRSKTLP